MLWRDLQDPLLTNATLEGRSQAAGPSLLPTAEEDSDELQGSTSERATARARSSSAARRSRSGNSARMSQDLAAEAMSTSRAREWFRDSMARGRVELVLTGRAFNVL